MKKLVLSTLTLMLMGVSSLQAEPPAGERAALMAIYNATGGANWTNKGSWGTGSVCDWNWKDDANRDQGAVCNDEKTHVIKLDFFQNNLSGEIPKEIGKLTELEHLSFQANSLTGEIPKEIGNLTKLGHLDLSSNNLTGTIPKEIGSLAELWSLSLNHNDLSGIIPKEIGNLVELLGLYLCNNNLSGTIPSKLSSLAKLNSLILYHNTYLTTNDEDLVTFINNKVAFGTPEDVENYEYILSTNDPTKLKETQKQTLRTIYEKIGKGDEWGLSGYPCEDNWKMVECIDGVVTKLRFFDDITAKIPKEIGLLYNLTSIHFEYTNFYGEIPEEIGNLTGLTFIALGKNNLTGSIPESIGNLTELKYIKVQNNQLTGTFPQSMGNLKNLNTIRITDNKLSGEIPSTLLNLKNEALEWFIVYNNQNLYTNNQELKDYINDDLKDSASWHSGVSNYEYIQKTNKGVGLSPIYYLLLN